MGKAVKEVGVEEKLCKFCSKNRQINQIVKRKRKARREFARQMKEKYPEEDPIVLLEQTKRVWSEMETYGTCLYIALIAKTDPNEKDVNRSVDNAYALRRQGLI